LLAAFGETGKGKKGGIRRTAEGIAFNSANGGEKKKNRLVLNVEHRKKRRKGKGRGRSQHVFQVLIVGGKTAIRERKRKRERRRVERVGRIYLSSLHRGTTGEKIPPSGTADPRGEKKKTSEPPRLLPQDTAGKKRDRGVRLFREKRKKRGKEWQATWKNLA